MKRTLIVLAVLLCLALGTLTAAQLWVNSARDRLELTENILAGDPAAAAGVTVTYRTQDQDGRLNWETRFTPGGEPETDFCFVSGGVERDTGFDWSGVSLDVTFYHSISGSVDLTGQRYGMEENLLLRMGRDVAERTGNGTSHTETLRVADYTKTWPVELQVRWSYMQERYDSESNGYLARYFRIPVEPEQMVEVTVTKHTSGDVTEVYTDYSPNDPYVWSAGVVTEDGAYLIARAENGDGTDLLQCPDGPGIHFVPLEEESQYWFDPAGLRLFYPTDARTLGLSLSEDESKLLLYTLEDEMVVLTVLDRAGAEVLQRLELLEVRQEPGTWEIISFDQGELHLVVLSSSGEFCLLQEEAEGTAAVLTGRLDRESEGQWDLTNAPVLAWDGERLIWGASRWESGVYLGVWTDGGLEFFARYWPGTFRDPWAQRFYLTYTEAEGEPLGIAFS